MSVLRFILGDQLTRAIPALDGLDPEADTVLMVEVMEEATYVPHHKQKITLVLSAMRHFADALRGEGVRVDYVRLDDPDNTGSFTGELQRAARRHLPDRIVVTEPGEARVLDAIEGWHTRVNVPVEVRPDDRFYCSREDFAAWAGGRTSYRMETFYRSLRARTGLLMEDGAPAGGRWNFDAENRKLWPADKIPPERLRFAPDETTRAVMALVAARFPGHFGDLDTFGWGVTREEALASLDDFAARCLPSFGDYQDAMRAGEPFLYHATLSPYLNSGLLTAREVVDRAVAEYEAGRVPLNAIEGFVRQILGWREFVRGVYWLRMPEYAESNALGAERALPTFYWTGETRMNCLHHAIEDTRRQAYAHHINRLMITGNFALLAGIRPAEIEEWYLVVYADAYEWVELPNVHGMAIFADGGLMSSKPYAAGGAYIDRMSNYCEGCTYSPKIKAGPRACPFNDLYWAFLIRNAGKLADNRRMEMPYRTLARWDAPRRAEIVARADRFLDSLPTGYP